MGSVLLIGFTECLQLITTNNCNTIADLHTLQITTVHDKSFQLAVPSHAHCLVAAPNNDIIWLTDDWLTAKLLLILARIVILGSESHRTHSHSLLSDGSGSRQHSHLLVLRWFSLYSLGMDHTEDIVSNGSSIVACISVYHGHMHLGYCCLAVDDFLAFMLHCRLLKAAHPD
jgi:hypothetical protein